MGITMSEYERKMTVSSTEPVVMTSAKIPAGVQLQVLIALKKHNMQIISTSLCAWIQVIYSGPYVGEGINIGDDRAYEEDRLLLFSLSASFYPAELAP